MDKDLYALASERVFVSNQSGEVKKLSPEKGFPYYGSMLQSFLALAGDRIDNISSVSGIGFKTAISFIEEFGPEQLTVEQVQASSSISKRFKTIFTKHYEQYLLSWQLVHFNISLVDTSLFPSDFSVQPYSVYLIHF